MTGFVCLSHPEQTGFLHVNLLLSHNFCHSFYKLTRLSSLFLSSHYFFYSFRVLLQLLHRSSPPSSVPWLPLYTWTGLLAFMFGGKKRNISYNKNTRIHICLHFFHTYVHTNTHSSPRAPFFPPLILPILPLPSLIKGHLLSFLSASPSFSCPSLIGGFLHVSDWTVPPAPPLVNSGENASPSFWRHSFSLWGRPPPLTLRLLWSAPPPPQAEKKSVRAPPGGRHALQHAV